MQPSPAIISSLASFLPERRRPNDALAAYFHRENRAALLSIDVLDIVYRLQQRFDGNPPCDAISRRLRRSDPPDITIGEIHAILCRCLSHAEREIPSDTWGQVQRIVAESTGASVDAITMDASLAAIVKAPRF